MYERKGRKHDRKKAVFEVKVAGGIRKIHDYPNGWLCFSSSSCIRRRAGRTSLGLDFSVRASTLLSPPAFIFAYCSAASFFSGSLIRPTATQDQRLESETKVSFVRPSLETTVAPVCISAVHCPLASKCSFILRFYPSRAIFAMPEPLIPLLLLQLYGSMLLLYLVVPSWWLHEPLAFLQVSQLSPGIANYTMLSIFPSSYCLFIMELSAPLSWLLDRPVLKALLLGQVNFFYYFFSDPQFQWGYTQLILLPAVVTRRRSQQHEERQKMMKERRPLGTASCLFYGQCKPRALQHLRLIFVAFDVVDDSRSGMRRNNTSSSKRIFKVEG